MHILIVLGMPLPSPQQRRDSKNSSVSPPIGGDARVQACRRSGLSTLRRARLPSLGLHLELPPPPEFHFLALDSETAAAIGGPFRGSAGQRALEQRKSLGVRDLLVVSAHVLEHDGYGRVVRGEVLFADPKGSVFAGDWLQDGRDIGILVPEVAVVTPAPGPLLLAPRVPHLQKVGFDGANVPNGTDERVGVTLDNALVGELSVRPTG